MIKTQSYKDPIRAVALCLQALILVSIVPGLVAASSASPQKKSAASPELVIDGTRRDFGEVFVGEELSHVFTVRNVGTAPLELANKSLTSRSPASSPAELTGVSSRRTSYAIGDYLKPAAAIRTIAAPT